MFLLTVAPANEGRMTNEELKQLTSRLWKLFCDAETGPLPEDEIRAILRAIYDRGRVEQWEHCGECRERILCNDCAHKPQE
jgi:hypothetical protein